MSVGKIKAGTVREWILSRAFRVTQELPLTVPYPAYQSFYLHSFDADVTHGTV